jgi:hypothetical protein
VRRHFYDLEQAHSLPATREALERIGALYGVEQPIRGRPPDERQAVRHAEAKPLVDSLRQWFEATWSKLSRKSETTSTIRYALSRWDGLTCYIQRWPHRDRQQRRRTVFAWRGLGPEELPVCRIGCGQRRRSRVCWDCSRA